VSDLSLRPRSAAELIDAAFRLYRQHFAGFITLSAIVYLPMFVLSVFIGRLAPQIEAGDLSVTGSLLAAFVALLLWYSIMEAALCIAASDRYHGREIEPGRILRDTFSHAGSIIAAKMWIGFVMFFAFLFFFLIFPPFYFFARYFAIPQAILFERLGAWGGLNRTRDLSKGEKWKVLKTLGLIWLMFLVTSGGIGLLLQPEVGTSPSILSQVISSLVSMIAFPLVPITGTLLYYDVRIRREGYDIEVLSAGLEAPAPAVVASQG